MTYFLTFMAGAAFGVVVLSIFSVVMNGKKDSPHKTIEYQLTPFGTLDITVNNAHTRGEREPKA